MKNLLLLLILVCLGFVSCDGKDRVHLSNTEILKQHKLLDSFSERVEYFPKEYNEVTIDTLLSNGFKVKIKNFTDMKNSILDEFKQDSILNKHFYRNRISEIQIKKNNKEILKLTVTNDFIKKEDKLVDDFILSTLNSGVWLDEEATLNTNKLILITSFCKPESDDCINYKIIINDNGDFNLETFEDIQ